MREAARRFDVAVTTVKRAVVRQRATGSLERRPIPGGPRLIGERRRQGGELLDRFDAIAERSAAGCQPHPLVGPGAADEAVAELVRGKGLLDLGDHGV